MANRRQPFNNRRNDFGRDDRQRTFARPGVSPWQGAAPQAGLASLLPLAQGSTEATLALANNLITNLLQTRQNAVPSLLDMPMRRDFPPEPMRFDRGGGPFGQNQRMGNQGNFRRMGNFNRPGDRSNANRMSYRPRDGPRQQNRSSQKREADSKPKPKKESEQKKDQHMEEVKTEPKEENQEEHQEKKAEDKKDDSKSDGIKKEGDKKAGPKTRYDEVDPSLLKCHICNTSMWDGRSFENHINGLAHSIMMQKTAESYALTADTMRQEFKIREMKRNRKARQPTPRDFYCAMCDMFSANGVAHRTTLGHRKLKKYLHPACATCRKEMPTRIELDEHRLTPEHLSKCTPQDLDRAEALTIQTLQQEQHKLRTDVGGRRRRPAPGDDGKQDADDEQAKVLANDSETTILDYKEGDDLTSVTKTQFPQYSTERGLGRSFLAEYRCVQCKLCNILLETDETAEVHLKTKKHYQLFTKLLKEKTGLTGAGGSGDNANANGGAAGVKMEEEEEEEVGKKRGLDAEGGQENKRRRSNSPQDALLEDDDDVEMGDGHRSPAAEGLDAAEVDADWELPADDEVENWEDNEPADEANDPTEEASKQEETIAEEEIPPAKVVEQETKKVEKPPAKASPTAVKAAPTPEKPAPTPEKPAPTPEKASPTKGQASNRGTPKARRGRGRGAKN